MSGYGTVSFPVELLQFVCEAADHSTLYSIALSDRTFNRLATPPLYSVIDLQLFSAIYACVRTLALPPSKISYNRDLASLVKTISLHNRTYDWARASMNQRKQLGITERRLAHTVPRMRDLRSFTCRTGICHTAETFINLANGTLRFVHTIGIDVELPSLMREEDDAVVAPPAVTGRGLKTLKLFHRGGIIATEFSAFICSLIAASRDTLEVFSLPDGAYGGWLSAWSSIPPLPALRDLYVPPDFHSLSAFQDTSRIRVLAIAVGRASFRVAPTAFSNLEEVTCSPRELLALLPEPTPHRRPIRSVTLYDVQYGIPQNLGMAEHVGIEGWHLEARPALRALRFSGARLTRLSFPVSEISVPFLEDLLPVFQELEYLYILLQVRRDEVRAPVSSRLVWADDSSRRVQRAYGLDEILPLAPLLARMPCLHTFLLCDKTTIVRVSGMAETYLDGGPSDFARNEDDQRHALAAYDQHSSSLRHAAFTSDFQWEKKEDGWHSYGHVIAEREPILSDGEDDDEQHDGKDRG